MNNLDEHTYKNDELNFDISNVTRFINKLNNIINNSYTTNKLELDKILEDELKYGKSRYSISRQGIITRIDPNADIVEYVKKEEVSFEDRMKQINILLENNKE
jgi:hypothetical protein